MPNEIRISTLCEIVQDNRETVQGITYIQEHLDGNSDSRPWGGSYTMNTAYTDAYVGYWNNVKVDVTSATGLQNGTAFDGDPVVTDGAIPGIVYVLAVEFVRMVGTATTVTINVSGEDFAVLDPGQSIVIPMEMGEEVASCKISAGHAFSSGSREAIVNVMLAGTSA